MPGEQRDRLTALITSGVKRGTTGLLSEYTDEELERVGERMMLVDSVGAGIGIIEVTDVQLVAFGDVTWEFARSEGEGDTDLEQWRNGHRRFFAEADGVDVDLHTPVVCVSFDYLGQLADVGRE